MIFTLTWKELREHQPIWITMAIMTVLLGTGLPQIVAIGDRALGVQVAALTVLGLAATYGVVCGAMMFAGEHEGGTLVFLDIFLGRRGLLWIGKSAIGAVLVLTQALAVATALRLLKQEPPDWAMALVGHNRGDLNVWFILLSAVSLEAYAWGLLGSSLTQRVLAGAAIAAFGTPVWLLALLAPPPVFFTLQVVFGLGVLTISFSIFLNQSAEDTLGPSLETEPAFDPKEKFLDRWDELERDDVPVDDVLILAEPAPVPASAPAPNPAWANGQAERQRVLLESSSRKVPQASSPREVLWWLTVEQAWPVFWTLTAVALLIGVFLPLNPQVLWPLATLLLGVVCGVAAFAPEQRDLSYQFLAAQHFPLKLIWRFKLLFWLGLAVLMAFLMVVGHFLIVALVLWLRRGAVNLPGEFEGTLRDRMGPILFFSAWLAYGFCAGQICVWLCRKSILAVLIAFLVGGGALTLWLPSLLCGGMSGWQVWVPALIMLLATWFLMRAWAGGRIQERKPLVALVCFGLAVTAWALLNFGYRAWEVPDVGRPLDPVAFRASFPAAQDIDGAKAIHQAVRQFEGQNDLWQVSMAEAARLPAGVLETPRADDQAPALIHLPACQQMTDELLRAARAKPPGPALEHLAQVLALSRNLRNKAPLESYLAGVKAEDDALKGLDDWMTRGKSDPKLLRQALAELDRHANETPPPVDCLQTECFRSGGVLLNPNAWTLAAPGAAGRVVEPWLLGSIALSLDTPWEAERKTRIWQLVWAGLFRAVQTPHWKRPAPADESPAMKAATREILQSWLPAQEERGVSLTPARMARLLDPSWLSDERLFCSVTRLREAGTRAQCRVDATRLAIALCLFRIDEGKPAPALPNLVPKYLSGLPTDPYSGDSFRYRIAPKNEPQIVGGPAPGQGVIWSTGPDRIDHGGRNHGGNLPDNDAQWSRGDLDLITLVPHW